MQKQFIITPLLISTFMMLATACSKVADGFAPGINVTSGYQLAYGNSASDRSSLADRIAGNVPPKFAEVINRWKRFSGTSYYADATQIVASPAYCQTTMDGTGMWAPSTSPVADPNTASACNTASMNSLSWIYLTGPDRLFNIQNTNSYNGSFSTLKFDTFVGITTVSSTGTDDDGIGVTIAAYVDGSNQVHTLSAYRTQGGVVPLLGWGVLHKVNGTLTRLVDNKSVGGVYKNTGGGPDSLGWNSRNSQIRIERTGNIVKAYCSAWTTGSTPLDVDPTSLIQIDLSDPANNLTDFIGPQAYGYETISQAYAAFTDLKFLTPQAVADPDYLYDLKLNLVYGKKSAGIGYELVPNTKALETLGFPKTITNIETQREFSITSPTSFTEL